MLAASLAILYFKVYQASDSERKNLKMRENLTLKGYLVCFAKRILIDGPLILVRQTQIRIFCFVQFIFYGFFFLKKYHLKI